MLKMAARIKIEFDDGESITKNVYGDDESITWPELLESFLIALQGFGYCLPAYPEELRVYVEKHCDELSTAKALAMNTQKETEDKA